MLGRSEPGPRAAFALVRRLRQREGKPHARIKEKINMSCYSVMKWARSIVARSMDGPIVGIRVVGKRVLVQRLNQGVFTVQRNNRAI